MFTFASDGSGVVWAWCRGSVGERLVVVVCLAVGVGWRGAGQRGLARAAGVRGVVVGGGCVPG